MYSHSCSEYVVLNKRGHFIWTDHIQVVWFKTQAVKSLAPAQTVITPLFFGYLFNLLG